MAQPVYVCGPVSVPHRSVSRCTCLVQSLYLSMSLFSLVTIPVGLSHYICAAQSMYRYNLVNVRVRFGQCTHMVWLLHLHSLVFTPIQFSRYTRALWSQYLYLVVDTPIWEGFVLGQNLCNCQNTRNIDMIKLEACKNTAVLLLLHLHSNMDEIHINFCLWLQNSRCCYACFTETQVLHFMYLDFVFKNRLSTIKKKLFDFRFLKGLGF